MALRYGKGAIAMLFAVLATVPLTTVTHPEFQSMDLACPLILINP
jgi:hypothetical protein